MGSFGFKVTMSLWHLGRVSNPRTAEIGSVALGVWPLPTVRMWTKATLSLVVQAGGPC